MDSSDGSQNPKVVGRKFRAVPFTAVAEAVFEVWMSERAGRRDEPLFPTRTGRRLSIDAVQRLVRRHASRAARDVPSIRAEKLHPHVLRHSCAMSLLQAGVDTSVIALWLGHADIRSTQTYLHAGMTIKQRPLERTTPATAARGVTDRATPSSPSWKGCNYADHRRCRRRQQATRVRSSGSPALSCRSSTVLTTNLGVASWGKIFDDPMVAWVNELGHTGDPDADLVEALAWLPAAG